MTSKISVAVFVCVIHASFASLARAQSLAVDLSQTVGASTEEVAVAASQLRAVGEVPSGLRFNVEAAWATRSATQSDVFGAAYPYSNRLQLIEAYGERMFLPGRGLVSIRAGRYRTPFGISSASDHAYIGFLRAPLIRYEGYFALSNNFLEEGVDAVVGVPRLSFEASISAPADVGTATRRDGLDVVVRGQGALGPVIAGVSHIRTTPYQPATFARGQAAFTGVDVRWMRGGVQVRGEWLTGRPFDGTTTDGGYADVILHLPSMGPLTAVLRAERLAYEVPANSRFDMYAQRYTAGARVRLIHGLCAQIDLMHQSYEGADGRPTALDFALTYSVRSK